VEILTDILRISWYVVGALAVIGGFIQFLWYAGKFPGWVFSLLGRVSWGRVGDGVSHLVDQLRADAWQPEWVIGIGRTGAVIAALIAENMRWLPPEVRLETINIRHGFTDRTRQRIIADSGFLERVGSGGVLMVDSEMYRGDTVNMVKQTLCSRGVEEIRVAILFKFQPSGYRLSEYNPDYIGERLTRPVLMPWLFTSQAKAIVRRVQQSRWGRE
jgi:hypoxanthine phosphoribosyltransferase